MQTKTSKPTTGINCITAGHRNAIWKCNLDATNGIQKTTPFLLNELLFGFNFLITY